MRLRTPVRFASVQSRQARNLLAGVVACALVASATLPATADTTEDQLQQLQAQEASQRSQLDQLGGQQAAAQATLSQLKANLDARQADLSAAYAQVASLSGQIHEFEGRESALQKRHDQRVAAFMQATRNTYKRGTSNWLVYVFNSTNFSELLDRLAYVTAVARNDISTARALARERADIADQRHRTEQLKAELDPLLAEIAARLSNAQDAYGAQALVASSLEEQQRAQLAALEGTLAKEKELEAALAAAEAAAQAAAAKGAGRAYGASCPTAPAGSVVFCGHGFGHGVGLGQYGALGMAQAGYGWQRIVGAFYPGTNLGGFPDQTVRVYLTRASGAVTASNAGASLMDVNGNVFGHVGPGATVHFSRNPDGSVSCDACSGHTATPMRLVPDPGGTFRTGPGEYRGEAWADGSTGALIIVNHVEIETYLSGLGEVPSSWPLQAIAAQVTAARTYALVHLSGGGAYDVDDTTRYQVYSGVGGESSTQVAAVNATRGQALFYHGSLIDAVFSSSDGGHTECASAIWGNGTDNPCSPSYLTGVVDNYDVSPLHTWYSNPHSWNEVQMWLIKGGIYSAAQCGTLQSFGFGRDQSDRVTQVAMHGTQGTCSVAAGQFMAVMNNPNITPGDVAFYGALFGAGPGSRAWPYF